MTAIEALYPLAAVAALFGLPEARLRYWAQTGMIGPSVRRKGRQLYSFADLIGVKVTKELCDGGIAAAKVRQNLEALRRALSEARRPLHELHVSCDGEALVLVEDPSASRPHRGGTVLAFAVRSLSARAAEVMAAPRAAAPVAGASTESAYTCFLAGLGAADAGDDARAEARFREALHLDPNLAAAWTNLGNLLERSGARGDAREAYQKALALDPDQPEARYNLANLHADLGETELALAEYRRVAAAAPGLADVHFNMALVLLRIGAAVQARASLTRFLELEPEAAAARQLLTQLEPT
jgi:tetratricopeptide (TPR) repeat protein